MHARERVEMLEALLAFDLYCRQVQVQSGPPRINLVRIYQVDTKVGQFCIAYCRTPLPLARVSDAEIVFVDEVDQGQRSIESVDRKTGAWRISNRSMSVVGTCQTRPFSGFSIRKR
jgi:hypothetical protein